MNYQRKNRKVNIKHMLYIILFAMGIYFTISNLVNEKGAILKETQDMNEIFVKIINNNISVLRTTSENDDGEYKSGLFDMNPLRLITNEISCFSDYGKENSIAKLDEEEIVIRDIAINPFKLDEKDIKKQETPNMVGNPLDNSKKKILIYHSHTTESYSGETRKTDSSKNMVSIGEELTKELQKCGFTVIHDKTIHDLDYNASYFKSRETVSKYIKTYGDFDLIIDMHRDSGPEKANVTAKINGENIARLMVVTSQMDLMTSKKDPRYDAHIKNFNSIYGISQKLYPGLFRERNIQINRKGTKCYNQDLSDNALLFEIGASCNTIEEAKASMKYFSKVLETHLNSK